MARTRQDARRRVITSLGIMVGLSAIIVALSFLADAFLAETKGDAVQANQPMQVTLVSPPAPPRLKDPGPLTQPTVSKPETERPPEVIAPMTSVQNPPLIVRAPKKLTPKTRRKSTMKSVRPLKTEAPPAAKATAPPASQDAAQRQDLRSAQASNGAQDNWLGRVYARLKTYRRYPPEEKDAGIEGKAQIWFSFDRKGHVVSSGLLRSSGNEELDDAAVALPAQAEPIPLPPEPDRLVYPHRMTIQIGYSLR